jgi:hypothetical protein
MGALLTGAVWAQDDEEGGAVQVGGGTLKIKGFVKSGVNATGNNANKLVGKGVSEQEMVNGIYGGEATTDDQGNPKAADDKVLFTPWNDDEGAALRAQVQLDYVNENVGASIRLRSDLDRIDGTSKPFNTYVSHAYGWFGFLNNIVEVSAGLLNNGKWGTWTGFHIDDSLDNKNGVKLEIKPIEGLSFGINTVYLAGAGIEADQVFNKGVYGVKFQIPDTFGIAAEFVGYSDKYKDIWLKNIVGGYNYMSLSVDPATGNPTVSFSSDTDYLDGLAETDFGTLFSAYFYGVENLALDLDGTFATYKSGDDVTSAFGLSLQGLYTLNALKAGLKIDLGTASYSEDGNGFSFFDLVFIPKASYDITEWFTAGLEIPIGIVDNLAGIGAVEVKDWKGGFQIGVKPKLSFTLGGGASVVVFYKLDVYTAGHLTKVMGQSVKDPEALFTNTVQLDFIWTF